MSARWPSRYPVWTLGALGVAALLFCAQVWVQYAREWSEAERVYLGDYLRSGIRGVWPGARGRYVLLNGVTAQGQAQLVMGDEAERVKDADGKPGYRLTDEGIRLGLTRLEWQAAVYNDRGLHGVLRRWVYRDGDLWSYAARPFYGSLALFALGLFVAVPKDRARRAILKHGRRLKGPELVTAAEFNTKLGRSKRLMLYLPDGAAFANEKMGWSDKLFNKNSSGWARIPREREGMHFVIAGDSGGGKAAAIREMLAEARARGEAAVVYDPAMEYLARYYDSRTGTFCSADPLAGDPSDPQSWNRYPYGRNDPIDVTDPSGQHWWNWALLGATLVADVFTFGQANWALEGEASAGWIGAADASAAATAAAASQMQQNIRQQPQQAARVNCPPWQVIVTMPGPTQAHQNGGISNRPVQNGDAAIDPRDFGQGDYYNDAANYGRGKAPANDTQAAARNQMNQYVRDLRHAHIQITPDWSTATDPQGSKLPQANGQPAGTSNGPYNATDTYHPPNQGHVDLYRVQHPSTRTVTVHVSLIPNGTVHCPH